ncbi:MAG: dockerin type I domain-containing protein, partial [Flavobacteriales bacterium]
LVLRDDEPLPIVDQVEFFFDDDGGFGNGVFQASLVDNEAIVQVPLELVNQGVHDFFVRVRASDGEWSTTMIKPILILAEEVQAPDLVGYEYFFDQEPGIGNGTLIDITPGQDFDETLNIPLDDLMQGQHELYVRFIDANGDVGTTYYQFFEVLPNAGDCVDFNDDGTVDGSDLLAFLSFFGTANASCETGDFNGDGMVSSVDMLVFLSFFG